MLWQNPTMPMFLKSLLNLSTNVDQDGKFQNINNRKPKKPFTPADITAMLLSKSKIRNKAYEKQQQKLN